MNATSSAYQSYLPKLVIDRLSARVPLPEESRHRVVLLFADISGFTALTERLAKQGAEGAERLTKLLNTYFGELVALITESGGDVLKFAGDAIISVWPVADEPAPVAQLVAARALEIQKRLEANTAAREASLTLKLALGVGEIRVSLVGGIFGRWETLLTGDPLVQVGEASHSAVGGDTVASEQAWSLIKGSASGTGIAHGAVKLAQAEAPGAPPARRAAQTEPAQEALFRSFVPAAIRSRIDARQSEWLSEIRRVSVLFINLPGITHGTELPLAQSVVTTIQRGVYQFEGSINKISVDDKGASALAVFGLPPLAHEDDPERALLAAATIQTMLADLSMPASLGVATGAVFAGVIGAADRKEYTVMGDTVNLAARLMMAAKQGILCDEATRSGARRGLRGLALEPLEPIKLKGKQEPVAIFNVSVRREDSRAEDAAKSQVPLIGRKPEREKLLAMLNDVMAGQRRVVLIEGEAGIGKSRLVEFALDAARAAGLHTLWGCGEAVDQRSPYRAWRPVVRSLLGLPAYPGTANRDSEREKVLVNLGSLRERAALLNDIVDLGFLDTAATKDLAGAARMGALRQLVLSLLGRGDKPYCVAIEDLHWLDSGSLGLIEALRQSDVRVLLVMSTRPLVGAHHHAELLALRADPALATITLDTLEPEEAIELAMRRLGVSKLSAAVRQAISELAQGHPFFSEELAFAIRDAGVPLDSEDAGALQKLALPHNVQGVITARIDKLPPDQQLTLKVASVIGRVFPLETVDAIHPSEGDRSDLTSQLAHLDSLQLTPLETPAPSLAYIFKHPLTHEVAYNLVLFEQRRQLHLRAAEWYESHSESQQRGFESVIAHHLLQSWDPNKPDPKQLARVVEALLRAGTRALYASIYPEAIKQYEDALSLLRSHGGASFERKELEILLQLGQAFLAVRGYSSPEVDQTYARARELASRCGDAREEFTALRGLWAYHTARAEYREARALGERMLKLATDLNDPALLLETHRSLGNTFFWLGDFERSIGEMESTIRAYSEGRDKGLAYQFGQDPGVACLGMVAWPLAMQRRFDEARSRGTEALDLATRVEHPYSKGYALMHRACVNQFENRPEEALKLADETIALSSALGFPNWLLGGLMIKGWALSMLGKPEEGAALLDQTLGTWRAVGCALAVPYFLTLLAECLIKQGKMSEARAKLEEANRIAEQNGEMWYSWRTAELLEKSVE